MAHGRTVSNANQCDVVACSHAAPSRSHWQLVSARLTPNGGWHWGHSTAPLTCQRSQSGAPAEE
eukprot:2579029-Pyramimonas_sp.AAC.1